MAALLSLLLLLPLSPLVLWWRRRPTAVRLHRLTAQLGGEADPLLCYPLFMAIAVVLTSHYDRSLLTLLLAVEAFAIYVLNAVLRDGPFRAVALIAQGLVFVGVGLLMLAMNGIASRYRGRLR